MEEPNCSAARFFDVENEIILVTRSNRVGQAGSGIGAVALGDGAFAGGGVDDDFDLAIAFKDAFTVARRGHRKRAVFLNLSGGDEAGPCEGSEMDFACGEWTDGEDDDLATNWIELGLATAGK